LNASTEKLSACIFCVVVSHGGVACKGVASSVLMTAAVPSSRSASLAHVASSASIADEAETCVDDSDAETREVDSLEEEEDPFPSSLRACESMRGSQSSMADIVSTMRNCEEYMSSPLDMEDKHASSVSNEKEV